MTLLTSYLIASFCAFFDMRLILVFPDITFFIASANALTS